MEKLGSGSTNQTELSAGVVKALLFPLPPLAEQKRIVAKIEELLPLVDRYEAAWTRLEDFNRHFPEDMKKSILQQAIQGKLVEQRPEEGTAQVPSAAETDISSDTPQEYEQLFNRLGETLSADLINNLAPLMYGMYGW